jgi:hypothetical protein
MISQCRISQKTSLWPDDLDYDLSASFLWLKAHNSSILAYKLTPVPGIAP